MDVTEEMRLTDRQRYWLEQIKACEASGKSVAAYAADQGFHAHAMYGAKKVLVRKGVLRCRDRAEFQRVQTESFVVGSGEWCIRLPNGVSVDFSGPVDAGSLSTVLTTAAHLE